MLLHNRRHFYNRMADMTHAALNVHRVKFSEDEPEGLAAQAQLETVSMQNRKSQKSICYNGLTHSGSAGCFENVERNMERAVAIKKLGKLLGKSLGYRVDPNAPNQEERDAARAKLSEATPKREALSKATDARRAEVLQADAEYQRLKAEYAEAKKNCDELFGIICHYRFTVGTSNGMFFTVKAQGDTWEQVFDKLTEKQAAA